MDVNAAEYDDVDRIYLAQNGIRWQTLVNAIVNAKCRERPVSFHRWTLLREINLVS